MRYSIEPRERRNAKGYGFLSFARNLNNKYGQKLVDSAKKSATDAFEIASKRAIQKSAEATGDLIGNKTADKITSYSKNQQMNHTQMMLDVASNKTCKFRTKNWVEINDESRGTYSYEKQIRFNTTMLKSSLCDYSDAYILVKGKTTITGAGADPAATEADERDKGVAFKNCAPFTSFKSDISNVEIDYCHDIDIVMPMYNLIEYSDNYAKTSGSFWKYYRENQMII